MTTHKTESDSLKLPDAWQGKAYLLMAVGLGLICVSGLIFFIGYSDARATAFKIFLHSYLANFMYCLSFGIGAMFFVLITFLTRASWNASVRRWAEIISMTIPSMAILFAPILLMVLANNASPLYEWNQAKEDIRETIVQQKVDYLNGPFFTARAVICLLLWTAIVTYYYKQSRREDETGGVDLTLARQKWSGPLVMLFALTVSMAAFDWIMSLDADWFSTIFGVYLFSASMFGFFAFMIVSFLLLQRNGKLKEYVNIEHYHDMAKFLFGFTMFWSYIAFSQLILIWYANIPEETAWFKDRVEGDWAYLTYGSIALHFAIPFLGLMSRHVRRHRTALAFWACWALIAHWLDMTFLVMPNAGPVSMPMILGHVLGGLGMFSIFSAMILVRASGVPLVALRDPRLPEAMSYANPLL
ncbi:MAG: quinol:cytochrome C oxidoreductase [Pirellulaceae bacterium]|nr:quinol:cytochrome C oxidoreductase [Pirellulaceae bacterium]